MLVCRHGRFQWEDCWECSESHWQTAAFAIFAALFIAIATARVLG